MIYEQIVEEKRDIEKEIAELEKKIAAAPEGRLICSHERDGRRRWLNKSGEEAAYLGKREMELARALAEKRLNGFLLNEIKHKKIATEFYLRHHHSTEEWMNRLLKETAGYRELLAEQLLPLDEKQRRWMLAEYPANPYYEEYKIHTAVSGNRVRSKSEVLIDFGLLSNKIAFRYECELQIGGHVYYPDFTILHPKTNRIIYWEHLGRADDPEYIKKQLSKLSVYMQNGIFPSINLIITCETETQPLTIEKVNAQIQMFFR